MLHLYNIINGLLNREVAIPIHHQFKSACICSVLSRIRSCICSVLSTMRFHFSNCFIMDLEFSQRNLLSSTSTSDWYPTVMTTGSLLAGHLKWQSNFYNKVCGLNHTIISNQYCIHPQYLLTFAKQNYPILHFELKYNFLTYLLLSGPSNRAYPMESEIMMHIYNWPIQATRSNSYVSTLGCG